jgi:hypothetical protein
MNTRPYWPGPNLRFCRMRSRRCSRCFEAGANLFLPDLSAAVSADPGDTKFLHCAEAAPADYIVTGNKRDFPEAAYGMTRVVNAGELLDWITLEI